MSLFYIKILKQTGGFVPVHIGSVDSFLVASFCKVQHDPSSEEGILSLMLVKIVLFSNIFTPYM